MASNSLFNIGKTTTNINDQLGNDDTENFIVIADFDEQVGIEEQTTSVFTRGLGSAFIIGHITLGVLGSPAIGNVLGSSLIGGFTEIYHLNPNNVFIERFRSLADTINTTNMTYDVYTYVDTSNTTATLDSVNSKVVF